MDEFWRLVLLSFSMFFGCYLAGSIPLVLSLSDGVLRKVTTFGAGLLIGTALIVIIPEGMESLFGNSLARHHHAPVINEAPIIIKMEDVVAQGANADIIIKHPEPEPNEPQGAQDPAEPEGVDPKKPKEDADHPVGEVEIQAPKVEVQNADKEVEMEEGTSPYTIDQLQFLMGLSLVVGFVFMLLVDQCGGGHSHSHVSDGDRHRRKNMTATIGLVVHAAADGLALGAAAGLSKADVELIIFFAIMLHKAPAAFGFTSFLIHEGYDKATAKKHLLVFALAAPVATFVSYFGLVRVMYVIQLPLTGIAMLFSAGTFLYVSTVHVLNEITQGPRHHAPSDHVMNSAPSPGSKLSNTELFLVVLGAFSPLVFNVFHSHGH